MYTVVNKILLKSSIGIYIILFHLSLNVLKKLQSTTNLEEMAFDF